MREERRQCEHRHPENGNCLPGGGFCPAVRDEYCLKLKELKAKENEAANETAELPSCNSCIHNGTWDCIKCSGFDRYEKRGKE